LLDRAGLEAPAERHEALAALAWAEAVAGSVDDAERLIAQLSQSPGLSDLEIYDLSHAEAFALMRRGRFADSYASSVAAGEAIERAGRADLSYGCWANAASAATAIADYERALEFLARGQAVVAANGLRSLVVHMLAARAFVLVRLHRLRDAEEFARAAWGLAEELGLTPLSAMAQHDLAMVLLEAGNATEAASLLTRALATPDAPISRPSARIALAEAHARCGSSSAAGEELRAAVLEPVRPSDFPETLVPRLERVQGLAAAAGGDHAGALRRLRESVASWERVVARISASQSIAAVLADLGRPVVGVVDPERELSRARAEERMLEEEVDRAIVS
jgi:tetratricopeptide (TPR) repeat protein